MFFCNPYFNASGILFVLSAKQVMELVGSSQSMFGDLVSELGLSAAMRPGAEYTFIAPLNVALNGEQNTVHNIMNTPRIVIEHLAKCEPMAPHSVTI